MGGEGRGGGGEGRGGKGRGWGGEGRGGEGKEDERRKGVQLMTCEAISYSKEKFLTGSKLMLYETGSGELEKTSI